MTTRKMWEKRGSLEGGGGMPQPLSPSQHALWSAEVIGYCRVSSDGQALNGDSINAQRSAIEKYCRENKLAKPRFIEDAGWSGKDDKRPGFQQMAGIALAKGTQLRTIVVFDSSRFFREFTYSEFYIAEFRKNGVLLASVADRFVDGPEGDLVRQITGIANQLMRQKNAIHVRNSMRNNALRGFSNGARPALGYKLEVAKMQGDTPKKHLVIDAVGAELVRQIFALCIRGENGEGGLGIKAICDWLNVRGYRTSTGGPYMTGTVEHILKNEAYVGRLFWDKTDPDTKKPRPRSEWIPCPCPIILDEDVFQAAQMALRSRAPKVTPTRVTNSEVLLTSLAYCECGAKLQIQTATGRSRVYRYYSCSAHIKGRGCSLDKPTRVTEADLDAAVTGVVLDHLLNAEFVRRLSASISEKFSETTEDITRNVVGLRKQLAAAKTRLNKLLEGFANGLFESDDDFKETHRKLYRDRTQLEGLIDGQERLARQIPVKLSNEAAEAAVHPLRAQMERSSVKIKKRLMQAVLNAVVVRANSIEVVGSPSGLLAAATGEPVTSMVRSELVRSSDREWWSRGDD